MTEASAQRSRESLERLEGYSYLASIIFCICVSVVLGVYYNVNASGDAHAVLADTININTEPIHSIARLNGIGFTKAQAIVEYRQREQAGKAGEQVFKSAEDVDKVKGIGPKTVEKIKPNIRF